MSIGKLSTDLEEMFSTKTDILSGLRKRAWEKAWKAGLPTRKTEAFRYLNLKSLWDKPFTEAGEEVVEVQPYVIENTHTFATVNGVYQPAHSSESKDFEVYPMEKAFTRYGAALNNRMERMLEKENSFFALLGKALQQEGIFIYVPPKKEVALPLHLLGVYAAKDKIISPRIQISIGAYAKVKIIQHSETISGEASWINEVCDISLEEGARCEMVKTGSFSGDWAFSHLRVSQKKDSFFSLHGALKGARCARDDIWVELLGEGACSSIKSSWSLQGSEVLHTQIRTEHIAPNTQSTQHIKGVVADKARASFEGQIYVAPEAQKTDAYQLSNQLILHEGASAFSKPNLEIFADDVKASHGATIADLSQEELFYLQTRGLSPTVAKKLLIKSFTHFFMGEIPFKEGEKALLRVL